MIARLRSFLCLAFHMERRRLLPAIIWLLSPLAISSADEPLRDLINRELAPPSGTSWPKASDAEFLRRVSLDLNGMPPSADEARAFLNDSDAAKREKLIDQLLASPLYARHMATTLDVMLMERRPNTHVTQDEWQAWLMKSVRENKPWNVLAKELMTADGDTPDTRAAARFFLDRNSEPHTITRDLGRIFFGRDMQCNQCHDSPIVSDYLQRDYHGLLAIASTSYAVTKKVAEKNVTVVGERSGSDLTFESVFDKGNPHRTAARLPGGTTIAEPVFYPGEEYTVAPADGVKAVPKFSRRAALAEQATSGANRLFNENIANRLWAMMLGRGLVHPLDMMHPDNPAASPALMKQLGERIVAMNFDMKSFLREIALSDVYQRPFDVTPKISNSLAAAGVKAAEIAARAEKFKAEAREASSVFNAADSAFFAAESVMLPVAREVDAARTQYVDAKKKLAEAQKALDDATAALNAKKQVVETLQQALTPLQTAVATLAGDPDLAATAKKLEERTQQLIAALPPLEQSVNEKTVAAAPLNEAVATTKKTLDDTSEKLTPLIDAVLAEENKVVAAREAMQTAQFTATSTEDQLATLERIATAGERFAGLTPSEQKVREAKAAFDAASKNAGDYMPVVAERTTAVKNAQAAVKAASAAVSQAQENVNTARTAATALKEAAEALQNARTMLSTDKKLSDETMQTTLATLVAKSGEAQVLLKSAEQTMSVVTQQSTAATEAMNAAQAAMAEANAELQRRQEASAQANTVFEKAGEVLTSATVEFNTAFETVPADLSSQFALSQLRPLTPEQMCWTIFRVTTVYDRYKAGEIAELEKAGPLTEEQKNDPVALAVRANDVEQRTFDKLKGNIGSYVQIYGGAPGQPQNDFYSSADQALFTANGSSINSWVAPAGDNPTERIIKSTDLRMAAEELYLGTLTRMPTEEEVAEVTAFLETRPDRTKAAQELVWGLISSAEFRFNK